MSGNVLAVTHENFKDVVVASEQPVMCEFYAQWCGPCRMMGPALEELSKTFDGKLKVCKVDIEESGNLTGDLKITSVPTVVFFKSGSEVDRKVGTRTKRDLERDVLGVLGHGCVG
jgi:thioredoxin 1